MSELILPSGSSRNKIEVLAEALNWLHDTSLVDLQNQITTLQKSIASAGSSDDSGPVVKLFHPKPTYLSSGTNGYGSNEAPTTYRPGDLIARNDDYSIKPTMIIMDLSSLSVIAHEFVFEFRSRKSGPLPDGNANEPWFTGLNTKTGTMKPVTLSSYIQNLRKKLWKMDNYSMPPVLTFETSKEADSWNAVSGVLSYQEIPQNQS
ncbi:hypothetical protein [Celerinatantimonas sp. MCCC 1A17872]|uniref:hypothetical protein n=1 Tax=Celerinatantimonas sp. MCCC 1A17872 TaxID=3177514 RepID=UPI0038CB43BA